MLLNWLERAAVNNPLRSALQRHVGAKKLIRLGGGTQATGRVLEIGCGRGVGADIALSDFCATSVDAFDLDPKMVKQAKCYLNKHGDKAHVWVGDASAISVPDSTYDAVLDFAIIHHVPEWRLAVREIQRVLKPGGYFYGEEVLRAFIDHPIARRLFMHPQNDRFDAAEFTNELESVGFKIIGKEELWGLVTWVAARKL